MSRFSFLMSHPLRRRAGIGGIGVVLALALSFIRMDAQAQGQSYYREYHSQCQYSDQVFEAINHDFYPGQYLNLRHTLNLGPECEGRVIESVVLIGQARNHGGSRAMLYFDSKLAASATISGGTQEVQLRPHGYHNRLGRDVHSLVLEVAQAMHIQAVGVRFQRQFDHGYGQPGARRGDTYHVDAFGIYYEVDVLSRYPQQGHQGFPISLNQLFNLGNYADFRVSYVNIEGYSIHNQHGRPHFPGQADLLLNRNLHDRRQFNTHGSMHTMYFYSRGNVTPRRNDMQIVRNANLIVRRIGIRLEYPQRIFYYNPVPRTPWYGGWRNDNYWTYYYWYYYRPYRTGTVRRPYYRTPEPRYRLDPPREARRAPAPRGPTPGRGNDGRAQPPRQPDRGQPGRGGSQRPPREVRPPQQQPDRGRETRPPQRETRPPQRETRPPQRETRPPQRETRPPQRETRPPQRETRPPQQRENTGGGRSRESTGRGGRGGN